MSKEKDKTPKPPAPKQSTIRSYFTADVEQRIKEMSFEQMKSVLRDLKDSEYWIAILKYSDARMPMLDSQLRMIDPYREPYKIAFAQGCMAGLCDLQTTVIELNNPNPPQDENIDVTGGAQEIGLG